MNLITPAQFGKRVGRSAETVRKWIARGMIEARGIQYPDTTYTRWLIPESQLNRVLNGGIENDDPTDLIRLIRKGQMVVDDNAQHT